VAPPWRHNRSLKKAAKNRGRPFSASSEERVDYEAGPPVGSPPLTLCSPVFRVDASKAVLERVSGR
jgi:hypothetical protein